MTQNEIDRLKPFRAQLDRLDSEIAELVGLGSILVCELPKSKRRMVLQ